MFHPDVHESGRLHVLLAPPQILLNQVKKNKTYFRNIKRLHPVLDSIKDTRYQILTTSVSGHDVTAHKTSAL